jgi:hypothetical protein
MGCWYMFRIKVWPSLERGAPWATFQRVFNSSAEVGVKASFG